MDPNSLEAFYTKIAEQDNGAAGVMPPADLQREIGHFNVFNVAVLMRRRHERPPMTFDRRAFYKISLIQGRSRIEYADQAVEVAGPALWFATSRVPYRWLPHDQNQTGHFCIFTEEFLLPVKGALAVEELPVFQPGGCPLLPLSPDEHAALAPIFEKMEREMASTYTYKYDLLRAYLLELIHAGQKLQPVPIQTPAHNASARVAALFTDLLERQFPLATPQQQLPLRTAKDYADALAVHVNHLNRALKDTTGHTTTTLISNRVAQEARMLLKQTTWTVSEIADSLGFADVAHFCNFFKRQTGLVPGAFRG
ncbi:helix-turn-helix domain-containing protein [Hymenobacter profundi]|uniref:Helix-turn-helix transcriptional regulator n=1 Tax=Hymenobacter profundi TaxID=1982110 RepID=A0ABS6WY32_9BACT|nr:helix-turn-helix transcriptional regulator [Hymenobacter profundi]MBW3128436.1 helix-turn-helix transcriptional regulator [Hymenobacter profundi]